MDEDTEREEFRQLSAETVKRDSAHLKAEAKKWDCECFLVPMTERDIKKVAHVGGMTDVVMTELGQGQSEPDMELLRAWRASEKAKRKKGQVGVSPTRTLGGVGGREASRRGKGSAGEECRADGIGGKGAEDVHKWKNAETTPEDILDAIVCTGMIWILTCVSDLTAGPKGRTNISGIIKWKKTTTGPFFRYWRFPALQVVGQGKYAGRNGKARHVWDLVEQFKKQHKRPQTPLPKHPPGWSEDGAPLDLLERDKQPAEDWGVEKLKMQEAGTWPVVRGPIQAQDEEEGSGGGDDDDEEDSSTEDEEVGHGVGHTLCLFSCCSMRLPCPFLPLFSTRVCVR